MEPQKSPLRETMLTPSMEKQHAPNISPFPVAAEGIMEIKTLHRSAGSKQGMESGVRNN